MNEYYKVIKLLINFDVIFSLPIAMEEQSEVGSVPMVGATDMHVYRGSEREREGEQKRKREAYSISVSAPGFKRRFEIPLVQNP